MWHILQLIFKYLNEESLFHSELTCKAWKAAIDDAHPSKLWNILFKQKVKTCKICILTCDVFLCLVRLQVPLFLRGCILIWIKIQTISCVLENF